MILTTAVERELEIGQLLERITKLENLSRQLMDHQISWNRCFDHLVSIHMEISEQINHFEIDRLVMSDQTQQYVQQMKRLHQKICHRIAREVVYG